MRDTSGARVMSPKHLKEQEKHGILIHVTFNSAIFGFLDDMYIMSLEYVKDGSNQRQLQIQSQLRVGSYDFN